jgi:hypothetical protein
LRKASWLRVYVFTVSVMLSEAERSRSILAASLLDSGKLVQQ